jgi:2-haloacid dehalogenase
MYRPVGRNVLSRRVSRPRYGGAQIPREVTVPQRPAVDAVVFDLGGVLIDWNPRYLFRKLFPDDEEMQHFLAEVCSPEWIARIDAGLSFTDAVAELSAVHPGHAAMIRAFHERWPEMVAGPIEPTVAILEELSRGKVRLFALSNWSAETFPLVAGSFPFLGAFEGVLISGHAGVAKPAPEIFRVFLGRFGLEAGRCLYVDDHQPNVDAAIAVGLDAMRFTDARVLRAELEDRGLLQPRTDAEP